ncbi:MAG: hypothetical protein IT380_01710 [Myxococcales bacterium]|nr:hypothetical protein [Myxococcales bacterium]
MQRFRIVAVLAVFTASTALAQYTSSYGYSFNNPMSAMANNFFFQNMNKRALLRSMLKKRGYTDEKLNAMTLDEMIAALGGTKKAVEASREVPAPTSTKFKPAGKRLLVPTLAASLSQDKAQQQALVELFEQGIKAYEQEAAKDGFVNDLAGAIAFFIGTAYFVFHEGQEPDEDGLTLFARQLQHAMDTPDLKKVGAADKQKFYELLVGMGTWLGVSYQHAARDGDEALKAQLRDAAGGVLKGYLKLEPSKLAFTANGLVIAP